MRLTQDQADVLAALAGSLVAAADNGLLDIITADIHPSTINTFCDAVDAAAEMAARLRAVPM